jgi:DNA-binding LytR/AlgR family response regulator
VNDTEPQSALREMRDHFSSAATLSALAAVAAVLTLVGPFGTDETLRPGFRALYWLSMVGATYVTGFAVDALLRPRLTHRVAQLVCPSAMALAITGAVVAVNLALLGGLPGGPEWGGTLLTVFAIAAIVVTAMQIVVTSLRRRETGAAPRTDGDADPPILERLPLDKRGPLVALSVEDHYTRVRTLRGEEMVLLRLSDAIRETAPVAGLRVHRSHWIATSAVRAARREGDRAVLTMAAGGDIPVSRSHIPAVKAAGLLPG